MKKLLFLTLVYPIVIHAQIITTVVGNGTLGSTIDGVVATSTPIGEPDGCAIDAHGNFYFTQVVPDKVFKVTPSGIITTVAGTASAGYNGDGIAATAAKLYGPGAIAFDAADNIYIADGENNRVRKIDAVTGIITTVAGVDTPGFAGDGGPASVAAFNGVEDICFDKYGNLYIDDIGNLRIRKINTLGIVSTIAGTGTGGHSGDGGQATAANIEGIIGICVDNIGNLYLGESSDAIIRKISTAGIITTIAGNGLAGPSGDGGPATAASLAVAMLVTDNYGNLFISGYLDNDVRMIDKYGIIHTTAGTGVYGFSGDNGQATAAKLSSTFGIALDTCGNVYVADKDNYRIRKIALNPECTPAGVKMDNNETALNIFPNPVFEQLEIDNIIMQTQYQLFNFVGMNIRKGTLKEGNNEISLESLPAGIYLLELTDDEGNKTVKKIIKQ